MFNSRRRENKKTRIRITKTGDVGSIARAVATDCSSKMISSTVGLSSGSTCNIESILKSQKS